MPACGPTSPGGGTDELPTVEIHVLDRHPDGIAALPGYDWLDMTGEVRDILERALEFTNRQDPPSCAER
jgi:hypothetical protein